MRPITAGDLVTFPLRDGKYGVAQLVHIDNLALHDLYHFVIRDAVVDGLQSGGYDAFGEPLEREHDVEQIESAPLLIEHIGVTRHGLDASDLSVVSSREVDEDELRGYHAWLHLRYHDAVKRGAIRDRIDDNPERAAEDEYEVVDSGEDEFDAATEDAEVRNGEELIDGGDGVSDSDSSDSETEESIDADAEELLGTSTLGIHDIALGDAIMRQRSMFERDEFRDSALARYIIGLGNDRRAIDATVQRLVDGDFAAGEELLDYGPLGMIALGYALRPDITQELAGDILQILVNSGEAVAYEIVGAYMVDHGADSSDPMFAPAVRGFCYAVMLTNGEPDGLKEHLDMLHDIEDPELADDVRSALDAVASQA